MKRYSHIIEEIVTWDNMNEAFDTVLRGTKRKRMSEGRWLIKHRDEFLLSVATEIESGSINLGKWHAKDILERGKVRHLQVFDMKTRIKVSAVMIVVDKYLRKKFIRTTASSIKGRGVHDLKKYIEDDLRRESSEIKYWYKFDIRKFYETVKQEYVMEAVRKTFKDKRLVSILEQFTRVLPNGVGMSMGMRSSQGLCNLLLSEYLDHIIKDQCGIKHYYRYCDDGVIGAYDKKTLWKVRDIVHSQIESIGQEVKHGDRIYPVSEGLDFLGYVIYPTHTLLRKHIKKTYQKRFLKVKSRRRRKELVASLYGMAKHADTNNLLKNIVTMNEFSKMGLTYKPEDGKKRFKGENVRLSSIVNTQIEIHDFEIEVKTKNGDRTLVYFRDPISGEYKKYFTASQEMTYYLMEARRQNALPFSTIIRSEPYDGGKMHYKFT